MRRAASGLLAGLLLAACASAPSSTPRPSTPPGLAPIAAAYLGLVAESNTATCEFNAVLSQSAPALDDLQRASADYAKSVANLIDGLRVLDWPADIAGDARTLVDALTTNEGRTREMVAADTMSAFIAADNQLIEANKDSAAAATQLRTDLGLASAGNPCGT